MQALKELYQFLREDGDLQTFLAQIERLSPAFLAKTPKEFSASKEMERMAEQLKRLKLEKLQELLTKLPVVPHITAIILKACKAYTIAFLIIPPGTTFDWHDHHDMNGISRCVNGELSIRSLDPSFLRRRNPSDNRKTQLIQKQSTGDQQIYEYSMDRVRLEKLDSKHNTISIIYPDSYNIHEIKSSPVQQSAFIDLLVPEYPDNACNYFETIDEKGKNSISLKKIPEAKEEIIGLDTLIKIFKEKASGSGKPKMPQPIRHPGQS